jgi:3-hydroxyisobutyrate dehydrogenase-like beta-hydroxyacid dehydrogenase
MRLTVLGMGGMGRGFATRAMERGHRVTVWNRTPGRADELRARGAVEARTVSDAVARADVTLVVVADDEAVLDLCLGIDGALASVAKGAILVNLSTVSPEAARELAEAGPAGSVLDAPVLGSPSMITQGAGRFLIGGPAETVRRLDPLWADLGSGYVHCGTAGAGAAMKLMCNLQLIVGVAVFAEAVGTARAAGIDEDLLRTVFADSPFISPATRARQDAVFDPTHPGWFSPELARKDVRLAISMAERRGIPVRIGPATENLLTAVIDSGTGWPDFAAVVEAFSRPYRPTGKRP